MRLSGVGLCFVLAAILMAAMPVCSGEETLEAILKDFLRKGKEAVAALATVKDQATAEAARPKLIALDAVYNKLMKLEGKPDKEMAELAEKYKKKVAEIRGGLEQQVRRLEKLPEVEKVLGNTVVFGAAGQAKRARARLGVDMLTTAVQAYRLERREFPATLKELAQKSPDGKGPFIKADDLTDPWGRPYQYDVAGKRNKGDVPDIWSDGPRPGEADSIIGNWMRKK